MVFSHHNIVCFACAFYCQCCTCKPVCLQHDEDDYYKESKHEDDYYKSDKKGDDYYHKKGYKEEDHGYGKSDNYYKKDSYKKDSYGKSKKTYKDPYYKGYYQ